MWPDNTLADLQRQIGQWGDKTFPHATPLSVLAHFEEEAAEFARSGDEEEAADCLILLLQHAHRSGYSLAAAVRYKMAVNRQRTWGAPDERGVVHHA